MQTPARSTGPNGTRIPPEGWFVFSLIVALAGTWIALGLFVEYGEAISTGKIVFGSIYSLAGWFMFFAFIMMVPVRGTVLGWNSFFGERPVTRGPVWFEHVSAGGPTEVLWAAVAVSSIALLTQWVWADIVDGIFAAAFVLIAHWYRRRVVPADHFRGWVLFYLAGGFVFMTHADKVYGHPPRDLYYLLAYSCWAALHSYAIVLLLSKPRKMWVWVMVSMLVVYVPMLELPGEFARQCVGHVLVGEPSYRMNVYYTKLRTNELYAVSPVHHDQAVFLYRRNYGLTYNYERRPTTMVWEGKGDQLLRTPGPAVVLGRMFGPAAGNTYH
ncbi:MAG: hypothetical protein AB1646_11350 [Thermodesulfobacteriota bacterium]